MGLLVQDPIRFQQLDQGRTGRQPGPVVYGDRDVGIEPDALDATFVQALQEPVQRLAAREEAVKVPSWSECQFCDIAREHCPERVEAPDRMVVNTDRF